MTNVLIIPTSGLMEFNASAAAGGFSGTLDNTYANAVRLDIANSATLRVIGKNATNNERLVVSGTNGVVLKVRDVSAAGAASASVETPIMSATYVSAGTVSATNYLNLPVLGEGQFVELSGDTMTGRLILSGSTSGNELLTVSGSATVSGQISSITVSAVSARFTDLSATEIDSPTISGTNISALTNLRGGNISGTTISGVSSNITNMSATDVSAATLKAATSVSAASISSTNDIRAGNVSSTTLSAVSANITNISATDVSAATLKAATSVSAASISSAGDVRGVSAIISNTVQAPTVSGTTGTFATQVAAPTVSGTTGTFATQVTSPTVSGTTGTFATQVTSPTVSGTNVSALTNLRGGNISGTTISGVSSNITNMSATDVSAATLKASTSLSAASVSSAADVRAGNVSSTTLSAVSASLTNISATDVSAATLKAATSVSAASISAATDVRAANVSATSVSAVSARFTDLSATSSLGVTISGTAVSAVSGRFTDLSATSSLGANISATNLTGVNSKFPNASANNLSVSVVDAGAVSGVAPTDLIIRATAGNINLSSGGTLQLNATAVDIPAGDLSVTGNFKATAKSFLIDHPTPNSGYSKLQYACLEGPENGVYVRGKADAAKADHIVLPYYWIDLVHADSITVQITPTNPEQKLYVEKIEDNKVYIKDTMVGDDGLTKSEYFYIVHGERKDINHLIVEY